MARTLAAFISFAVGIGAAWAGAVGVGPLPPLSAVLSPSTGVWVNALDDLPGEATLRMPGLTAQVDVRYDQRNVPHIFATNELDAVRALGYVIARDRFFQLELQSRAGEGTLTELVGNVALPADRETRRLGMPRSAERHLASLDANGPLVQILQAYADGINAYRTSLLPAQYPVEYKLLGKAPREWLPVYSLHLLNRMGYTLAHAPVELDLLRARALVGNSAASALFDSHSPVQEPIQPAPRSEPREVLTPLPPPGKPDTAAARFVTALLGNGSRLRQGSAGLIGEFSRGFNGNLNAGDSRTDADRAAINAERAFASNNWAVAPGRSASGNALLEGDPHLELTLPSIWYEVHIVVPDTLDVGGVSIPGLPGVVIGYTRSLAWSFTNTGADVMDFWRETVDDAVHPASYQLDGEYVPLADTRVETYRGPRGDVLAIDTVYYSHRGPMRHVGSEWLSMRWTVLEAGNELMGFRLGQRAHSATAFLDSMAVYYQAPAQNMIVADTSGTIAIRSTGLFPVRADSGSGMEIREGNTRRNDWIGYRPVNRYPQSVQPAQGYLASANQEPIDPLYDSLYLGVDEHYEIWRALQINRLLRADSAMTPDRMRQYQTDPGSVRADRLVPAFINAAVARRVAGATSPSLAAAEGLLSTWNRRYTRDNTGARLFEMAMSFTTALLYDELSPPDSRHRVATPSDSRLLQLIGDSANAWWDDRRTSELEGRDIVLASALAMAYDSLAVEYGDPGKKPWIWGSVAPAHPKHLLGLAGFSSPPVPIDGGRGTLNPSVGSRFANFGSSWRMVVELSADPVVRATYPGGQSGNPASLRYLDRMAQWGSGTLDSVRIPRVPADLAAQDVRAMLTLTR